MNPLQGGFRQGYGCTHTAHVLQEAIQSLWERSKKAYVAFLDVRKAFDMVFLSTYIRRGLRGISGDWSTIGTEQHPALSSGPNKHLDLLILCRAFGRVESCPHFYTVCLSTNSLMSSLHLGLESPYWQHLLWGPYVRWWLGSGGRFSRGVTSYAKHCA